MTVPAPEDSDEAWLRCFHRGDREVLARCYHEHLRGVTWAVGQVLGGVDRETVVQDVFCRLFGEADLRANYQGGNLGAWLITVARRQAIDFRRKHDRERPTEPAKLESAQQSDAVTPGADEAVALRLLVERFEATLPPAWVPLFRARFLERLDQRTAARQLGMRRTTLAYHELKIRRRLRRFVLEQDR